MDKLIKIRDEKVFELNEEIEELKRKRGGISRRIAIKENHLSKVKNIGIFDKNLSLYAIRKLVSMIEGQDYQLVASYYDENTDVFLLFQEDEETFFEVACCNRDKNKIDYTKNVTDLSYVSVDGFCCIDEERYLYILEFMGYVMSYRLLKIDYEVSMEEMNQLVMGFVCQYKGNVHKKVLAP